MFYFPSDWSLMEDGWGGKNIKSINILFQCMISILWKPPNNTGKKYLNVNQKLLLGVQPVCLGKSEVLSSIDHENRWGLDDSYATAKNEVRSLTRMWLTGKKRHEAEWLVENVLNVWSKKYFIPVCCEMQDGFELESMKHSTWNWVTNCKSV